MSHYGYTETNLPKGAQQELDDLRKLVIKLREAETARLVAHVVRLDREWFVMPGPQEGQPTVRLWALTNHGPVPLGELRHGESLMIQQEKESDESHT
jgi:hypothetical protein